MKACVSFILLCVLGAATAAAQPRQWPTERPPQPLAARDIKFPPYDIQTLPNGLQVVAVLHHEQPVVSMRLLIRAGSSSDARTKLGLAHLAANLLDHDSRKVSDRIPAYAQLDVGLQQPPGDYTLKVIVTDRASKKSQTLTRKLHLSMEYFLLSV